MKILWMGTGVMGGAMAGHVLAAGHELAVHSRTRAKAAALETAGASWVENPADGAADADVVCAMLGYPSDVERVVLGREGVLEAMKPGAMFIDFTTSSPGLAKRIAEAASEVAVAALDAPVSGGDVGARNATLSIMVGGDAAAFEDAMPLFACLGKTVVLQGPPGSGQHTKMVNQILVAGTMIGICEALLYAQRSGLDPVTVLRSVGGGAAASWGLTHLAPRILDGDLEPGFYVEHFLKDMGIALEECSRMNLELPGLKLAHELYDELRAMGMAKKGTQALIRALEHLNRPA